MLQTINTKEMNELTSKYSKNRSKRHEVRSENISLVLSKEEERAGETVWPSELCKEYRRVCVSSALLVWSVCVLLT